MTKYLLIGCLALSVIVSLTCCKIFGHDQKGNAMEINYSGKNLVVNDKQGEEIRQLLQDRLANCSDIYQLVVTQNVIKNIKNAEYLEIRFANHQETVLKNGEKVVFNEMLIPLSGEYAPNDQITFFISNGKVHQTPYLNTTGRGELTKRLNDLR